MLRDIKILSDPGECPYCSSPGFSSRKPCRVCGVVVPSPLSELGPQALINRRRARRVRLVMKQLKGGHEEALYEAA